MKNFRLKEADFRKLLATALMVFILFSVSEIFNYLSSYFGYKRYFMSMEMVFSFVLLAFGFWRAAFVMFMVAIFLEMATGAVSIFNFFNYTQLTDVFGFVFEANSYYIYSAIFCIFALMLMFFLMKKISMHSDWKRILVVGALMALTQGAFSFREGNFTQPSLLNRENLIFGSSIFLIDERMEVNEKIYNLTSNELGEFFPISHPSAINKFLPEIPPKKMLLIVAESWGMPHDERILKSQISSIINSKNVIDLKIDRVKFAGPTIFGEFRELCGKVPTKLKFKKISSDDLGECLPKRLGDIGYATTSIHAAHSTMYDRLEWYPAVGLQKMIFREVLPLDSSRKCYSFPGYCDRYLFPVVTDEILKSEKSFVYWMTLNTHTPFDKRDLIQYSDSICKNDLSAPYTEQLCVYHLLHRQFFDGLALMVQNPDMKGLQVIVVGDHVPILNDQDSRGRFEDHVVPAINFSVM